jgi:hypothetical protein
MACRVTPTLVVQQIAQIDSTMASDHMEWDLAGFHQPDQEWTGDTENIRGALGGELLMLGDNRNRVTGLQVPQDDEEKVVHRLRDGDLAAVRSDQLRTSGLNRLAEIADLRLLGFRDRDGMGDCRRHSFFLVSSVPQSKYSKQLK